MALLLVGAAAWPRLAFLGQFSTVDEVNFWYRRTSSYDRALRAGDYGATLQSGHPGATTMALGTLGLRLSLDADPLAPNEYMARLARARLPLAIAGATAIGLGYLLLLRLFDPSTALLAAALWAGDLLLIGHSRILHLDALLTSLMTLSVLLLTLLGTTGTRKLAQAQIGRKIPTDDRLVVPIPPDKSRQASRWYAVLIAAGICTGLALLTKSPAVLLLPLAGLFLLLNPAARPAHQGFGSWLVAGVRYAAPRWLLFVAIVAVVFFVGWPAMWVEPLQALRSVVGEVMTEGMEPHATGNYFFGRYDEAPGAAFYPLVLLFRLSPLTLLGLVLLPLALRPRAVGTPRRASMLLGCYALAFLLLLSLSAKKFDRYLLPVFPALDILAAVGIVGGLTWALGLLRRGPDLQSLSRGAALALTLPTIAALVWWYQPYQLAYFNPLLGGGAVGQYIFLTGWGEGMEQAAAFINREPGSEQATVATTSVAVLRTSARFEVIGLGRVLDPIPQEFPNYLVLYSSTTQRGIPSQGADWMYRNATPLHIVTIHGVEYARLYQIAPTVPQPRPADFGPAIHLRGYDLKPLAGQRGVQVALFWQAYGPTQSDVLTFIHLVGPDGRRYAQVDLAPGGDAFPTSAWSPGRFLVTHADLALPLDAPPGRYTVAVGVYAADSGTRLPLSGAPAIDPAIAGPDALLLAEPELP